MSWAFLDDHADENAKLLAVGAEAAWYYACGLCFCRRNEHVPGFIPDGKALVLFPVGNSKKVIALLVSARLWHKVDGGYEVHDYGQVYGKSGTVSGTDLAAKRAEAGRLGGLAKASKMSSKNLANAASKDGGPELAISRAHRTRVGSDPTPDPVDLRTTTTDLTGISAREAGNGGSGGSAKISCPRGLQLTADQRATLESGMIPGWAIDVLTTELVATWVSDPTDLRPLGAWLKCLSKAVAGEWNKRGSRLIRPSDFAEVPSDSVNSPEGFVV